jgi:hypothetical protein
VRPAPVPLKFGPHDLVYGPSAGGKLRELQQRAGGKLLTDLTKPEGMAWERFTVHAMETARSRGAKIHFDLTHMEDIEGVLAGTSRHAGKVTGTELRYLRDHWKRFQKTVTFYRDDVPVEPPWTGP